MEALIRWTAHRAAVQQFAHPAAARRFALLAALLLISMGARQQSANFIVETADPAFAQQMVQAAEKYRHDLAVEWLGAPMPNWAQPCVMTVQAGPQLGNGGATTFVFDRGEVFGWRMTIQGSRERLLDSVLPHEITHMVFASHFRQPLPRWADEGGASTVENISEKNKYLRILYQALRTGRGIAFNQMFNMTDYPQDIMPLYAQGFSLADYLIQTGGRRRYIEFIGDGLKSNDWPGAVRRFYDINDLGKLQNTWLAWVERGSPALRPREQRPASSRGMLASSARRPRPEPNLIYHVRGRSSPHEPVRELEPVQAPVKVAASAPPDRLAASVPRSAPKELPASGWHASGTTAPPPAEEGSTTQVAHPQPIEHP